MTWRPCAAKSVTTRTVGKKVAFVLFAPFPCSFRWRIYAPCHE